MSSVEYGFSTGRLDTGSRHLPIWAVVALWAVVGKATTAHSSGKPGSMGSCRQNYGQLSADNCPYPDILERERESSDTTG